MRVGDGVTDRNVRPASFVTERNVRPTDFRMAVLQVQAIDGRQVGAEESNGGQGMVHLHTIIMCPVTDWGNGGKKEMCQGVTRVCDKCGRVAMLLLGWQKVLILG